MAHSPTPWRKIAGSIVGADNDPICHMAQVRPGVRGDERKLPALDAAFIARACNAHEDMLAALQVTRMSVGWQTMSDETRRLILAAIAKAEAQS